MTAVLSPIPTSAANRALKRRATKHYQTILPEIKRMLEADMSLTKISRALNAAGYRNTRGKLFSRSLVHYVAKSAGLIVV